MHVRPHFTSPFTRYIYTSAEDRREYQAQVNVFASAARAAARQEGVVKDVRTRIRFFVYIQQSLERLSD